MRMDKRTINKAIKYFENRLIEDNIPVSQIIIFGSQAKRNSSKDSDLDLIIVSEKFRRKSIFKRADMIGDALFDTICKFKIPIDALLKTPEEIDREYLEHIGAIIFAA